MQRRTLFLYISAWAIYAPVAFFLFPLTKTNVLFPIIPLLFAGGWLFGKSGGFIIILGTLCFYITVNEFMQTSVPGVYAIGDIVPTPLLAHTASAEGILAVDHLAGKHARPLNYGHTPNCTYCTPEIASVGLTEQAAKDAGHKVRVGKFPFSAIGKAMILGETDGFIKIVSDEAYDEVLGVHAIGPKATELISEACLGLTLETTVEEMAKTVHPHPTLSEAMMEAAHGVYGEAIHF